MQEQIEVIMILDNSLFHWVFHWDCSSIGQSTALSRRKLRVRAPSVPAAPIKIHQSIHLSPYMTMKGGRGQNCILKLKRGSLFPFLSLFVRKRGVLVQLLVAL